MNAADFMKLVVPCETATNALFVAGTVIVTLAGMFPLPFEVNVDPLVQADVPGLASKQ